MPTVAHPPHKGYRTIRFPLAESEDDRFLTDRSYAKDRLEALYGAFAEVLPEALPWGYAVFGFPEPSLKPQRLCRRLRLEQGRPVFPSAPALGMPDLTGWTHDVDQALFRRRLHVPWWAMAHVCGHDAMSGYRLDQGLGRCSLVGSTIKNPEHFPKDLVAEAKPSWLQGARVYIATTAAPGCILGASVAPSASQRVLEKASGVFASAAQALDADDAPETVHTNGWQATQGAWKALCPQITVLLWVRQVCLHLRDRAPKPWGAAWGGGGGGGRD